MKKTYTLTLNKACGDCFYRTPIDWPGRGMSVCEEFVEFMGVKSHNIKFSVSTVRSHKKGWVCVRLDDTRQIVFVGKKRQKFYTLFYHRDLFAAYDTNIGWVKVESV
jgi:hypothetical protein